MAEPYAAGAKWLLIVGMLVTGICNSIFSKWQDMQCVEHCGPGEKPVEFAQPVWQTLQMFVGEMLCLIPLIIRAVVRRLRHLPAEPHERQALMPQLAPTYGSAHEGLLWVNASSVHIYHKPQQPVEMSAGSSAIQIFKDTVDRLSPAGFVGTMQFLFPTICDILSTTLMNVALLIMPVSVFQMTRGALVLWVGLFSVIFLHYHMRIHQWLSLGMVMSGVLVVGLSSLVLDKPAHTEATGSNEALGTLIGLALVLFAQVFAASQFVAEEKIMAKYDVEPMLAVALEGLFGTLIVLFVMPLMHYFVGSTEWGRGGMFDMVTAYRQITNSPGVMISMVLVALCISMYNMFGLKVTRTVSATARSTLDTCRSLGIWMVSIALGWELLQPLSATVQITGFSMLAYGTFVFNGIVPPPKWMSCGESRETEAEAPAEADAVVGADAEADAEVAQV
ncbi:hypothetical protein MCUN1_001125 [Malassezia cuniculi]|uniref:Integral membrane protein n=1 Tax=Malassezia cuniculi TaxID=948313 RepID=A0AAF0ETW1_9BASI|nr:hypothetical protein MCUN1_001125 [Malassezia cuniculi]